MVLDAERWNVEERNALGGSVVEVDMSQTDAAKTRIVDDRRHSALHPEAQVAVGRMCRNAVGKRRDKFAQAGKQDAEAMILRGDLHAPGQKVHDGVVAATMAELQLLDLSAGGLADHLVSQTDAEDGHLAQQLFNLRVSAAHRIRIARTVGKEHAVRLHCKHVFSRSVPRNHREIAAATHKILQDGELRAAIVGNHLVVDPR